MPRLLFFCLLFSGSFFLAAQSEADYISVLADHLDAEREVAVTSGRADLVTATHAYEVERAPKWKNSIGQALWYGMNLNKSPGIILLVESAAQRKYAIQLGSALDYAGLTGSIEVRIWPDDFPGVRPAAGTGRMRQPAVGSGEFWLNLNGNKRHTSRCRWFRNTTKGRLCTAAEGTPAGCCH